MDDTENGKRKQAERSPRESEEKAARPATFPEMNPNPVIEIDFSGRVTYVNPSARKKFPGIESSGARHPMLSGLAGAIEFFRSEADESIAREVEVGGRWFQQQVYHVPGTDMVRIYARDITDRKRAEDTLRESERRMNRSQEIAHLGSWELDLASNSLFWSDEVYRIFGLKPQEFGATYEAFLEHVHPDDRAAVDAAYSGSLREGRDSYDIEHRIVRKATGEVRFVHERCEHLRDASGRIVRSIGMVHDITERRLAEDALEVERGKMTAIIENMDVGVAIADNGGRLLSMNAAALAMHEFGSAGEMFRRLDDYASEFELRYPDGRAMPPDEWPLARALRGEFVREYEACVRNTRTGRERIWSYSVVPLRDSDGEIVLIVINIHDQTEGRLAEDATRKSLEEKEIMLKEIHHRVKNNLQMISSLLHLESANAEGKAVDALEDSQRRVRAIAMVHEALYEAKDLANIDAASYVRRLSENVLGTYGTGGITLGVEASSALPIKIGKAIPMGLIANELLVNSVKHAFPDMKGCITVSVRCRDGTIELDVSDDGVGLPKNFDPEKGKSLGMKLVKALADQLEGRIEFMDNGGKGTTARLSFPDK
jgi:PAS domain S-box-containing protein